MFKHPKMQDNFTRNFGNSVQIQLTTFPTYPLTLPVSISIDQFLTHHQEVENAKYRLKRNHYDKEASIAQWLEHLEAKSEGPGFDSRSRQLFFSYVPYSILSLFLCKNHLVAFRLLFNFHIYLSMVYVYNVYLSRKNM